MDSIVGNAEKIKKKWLLFTVHLLHCCHFFSGEKSRLTLNYDEAIESYNKVPNVFFLSRQKKMCNALSSAGSQRTWDAHDIH